MAEKKNKSPFSIYWIYAIIGVAIIAFQLFMNGGGKAKINTKQTFFTLIEKKGVEKVRIVNRERVEFQLNQVGKQLVQEGTNSDFQTMKKALNSSTPNKDKKVVFELEEIGDLGNFENEIKMRDPALSYQAVKETDWLGQIIGFLLPIIILVAIWMFVMRRMGGGGGGGGSQIFNIGKSRAQVYEKGKSTNITFEDVAGLQGAKEEIVEIVEFLKNPKKYTELGAKIPKGALLVGPPGTGKTLLAKAVAGEAKVPFFSLSGSDFVEMFVGVGASRVRDLFKQAKEKAPAIIFIDEIDAIGRARGKNNGFNSNDERENTLNQLLTEMDGFGTNSGVNSSAATYVAYLFATCAGVSKVFSYTGNGSTQTINCGFTAGSRFVLIKRTDASGDWYVWDSARGIVSGNDPHLSLNTTASEVTTNDTIDTDSTGFVVNQVSATNVNVSSATYIGLAIA